MITITRSLARQLRAVFRRALKITPKGAAYPILLDAGPNGLCVQAMNHETAVEYRRPGNLAPERLSLPFRFLVDCEGRKDDSVTIEVLSKKQCAASWRDGNVPQVVRYERAEPKIQEEFPSLPDTLAENPAEFLSALDNASETTDPQSIRYAIGCILLRGGDGSIAATDGRQLLVQSGFALPWQDEVLIPAPSVFGCREFLQIQPVYIGRGENWVSIKAGQWTIHLRINKDGRFPKVESHIPNADAIKTRCRLSSTDAQFLAATLPRLPCDDEQFRPVTVDLNGSVAIRGKPAGQGPPTECVLSNSTWSGEPLRLNTNRRYLARADFQHHALCGLAKKAKNSLSQVSVRIAPTFKHGPHIGVVGLRPGVEGGRHAAAKQVSHDSPPLFANCDDVISRDLERACLTQRGADHRMGKQRTIRLRRSRVVSRNPIQNRRAVKAFESLKEVAEAKFESMKPCVAGQSRLRQQ